MINVPPLLPPAILAPPAGWLGYLGIKNGGKQPRLVMPDLASMLEMSMFYRAGNRVVLFGPGAGVVAIQNGLSVLATVPNGKVWCIESVGAVSTAALGAVANVIAQISINASVSGAGAYMAGPPSNGGRLATTGEKLTCSMTYPVVALPGDTINVFTIAPLAPTAFSYFGFIFGLEVAA